MPGFETTHWVSDSTFLFSQIGVVVDVHGVLSHCSLK